MTIGSLNNNLRLQNTPSFKSLKVNTKSLELLTPEDIVEITKAIPTLQNEADTIDVKVEGIESGLNHLRVSVKKAGDWFTNDRKNFFGPSEITKDKIIDHVKTMKDLIIPATETSSEKAEALKGLKNALNG